MTRYEARISQNTVTAQYPCIVYGSVRGVVSQHRTLQAAWRTARVGLCAMIVALCVAGCGPVDEEARRQLEEERHVQNLAKKAVRLCLKHPDDASFGWKPPDIKWTANRSNVVLRGTVKAPNALGVRVTYKWGVMLTRDKSGAWQTGLVVIDEKVAYSSLEMFLQFAANERQAAADKDRDNTE